LVSDELERLSHGVLDHFFFGFLGLFKPFVQVLKYLSHKSLARILHRLPCPLYPFLFDVYRCHQKIYHVTKIDQCVLFADLLVLGKLRKLQFGVRLVFALVHWLDILFCWLWFFQSEVVVHIQLAIKKVWLVQTWEWRLDHSERRKFGSVHRK
jgi:hypothetical protein